MSVELINRSAAAGAMMEANVRLPEQFDSSDDDDEEPSPRKRPRSPRALHVVEERPINKNDWDHYVRSGAKLKNLAASVLSSVLAPSDETIEELTDEAGEFSRSNVNVNFNDNAAKLAYEKTAECMILEKKLKEAESHAAAMMAANTSLRESANSSNERMERTIEALRIAGTNAANARADADAAEAYAASLASQLESLRHVVQETKRATNILQEEHEMVAAATRSVESKLLMRETELFHLQKARKAVLADHDTLKRSTQELMDAKKKLALQLQRKKEQIKSLSREIEERDALEQARKGRSVMVEKELRDARSLLVEASSTAVETETTIAALKETIETFLQENKSLHAKIQEIQERSRANEERLQETLVKTEKTAQTLRIKATSHNEQMNHVLSKKAGCEKQINQQKSRITNLERRFKDTVSYISPSPATATVGGEPSTERKSAKKSFSIPPLNLPNGADKSPATSKSSAMSKSTTCSMCFKAASGLMKTCQCGKPQCDKRAHSICLNKNTGRSISHPGSPSPLLPIILCRSHLN